MIIWINGPFGAGKTTTAAQADLVVDTSDIDAAAAARRIARRIEPAPGLAPGYPDGDLRE